MPKSMSKEGEEKIIRSVSRACAAVKDLGSPTEAVIKIAREEGLGPDMIRLVCYGYNTGASAHYREKEGSTLERFADFPLADPERVIEKLYPSRIVSEKAAGVGVSLEWKLPPRQTPVAKPSLLTKAASIGPPCEEPVPLEEMSPTQRDWAWLQKSSAEQQAEHSRRREKEQQRAKLSAAQDDLRVKLAALVDYYKQSFVDVAAGELAFALRETEGRAGRHLIGCLQNRCHDKQASFQPVAPRRAVDWSRAPYSLAKQALDAAAVAASLQPTPEPPPAKPLSPSVLSGREQIKFSASVVPFTLGSAAGRILGNSFSSDNRDKKVDKMVSDLTDPQHEQELRRIQTEAMLQDLLDNDEVVSGYDPESVYTAFNEIASATPRVASQAAMLRPILRKHLTQGGIEPFEASELAGLERTIGQSQSLGQPQQGRPTNDKQSSVLRRRSRVLVRG